MKAARMVETSLPGKNPMQLKSLVVFVLFGLSVGAVAQDKHETTDDLSASEPANGSNWQFNWTTTLKYSAASRLRGASPALTRGDGNAANFDDGDRNFDKGLVSNRLDLLSELDAVYGGRFGVRVSGAAWYDAVYNAGNDNPGFAGGALPNHTSKSHDRFVDSTRSQSGRDAELRDAFVYGKFGEETPVAVRLGQHSVIWGESLYFAGNAIAGAQNAFDINRLLADPTAQAKEFVLPVPQISAQTTIEGATIAAYYQFGWRRNRFPGVGSYFSASDIFGPGAEHMYVGPGQYVSRINDIKPDDQEQGGISIRWRAAEADFGVYWLRFNDHTPQLVTTLGLGMGPSGPVPVPDGFVQTYHQGTNLFGVSASRTFDNANVAIEASIRNRASLASSGGALDMYRFNAGIAGLLGIPVAALPADNEGRPAYAIGRTAHINLSTIWTISPNAWFNEASFVGEIAWNRMLSCDKNCDPMLDGNGNVVAPAALDPNGTRDGWGMRFVFTPTYRQVIPGLDVSVPFGVSYSPKYSRPLAVGPGVLPPAGGGDITLGINGVYDNTWSINLQLTHFYDQADTLLSSKLADASAPPYTWGQTLRDRDFVTFTVSRSF